MAETKDTHTPGAQQLQLENEDLLTRFAQASHQLDHLDSPALRLVMAIEFGHLLGKLRELGVSPNDMIAALQAARFNCQRCLASASELAQPAAEKGPPYYRVLGPLSDKQKSS